jgi:hypothetical protein
MAIPSFSLGARLALEKVQSALAFEGWTMFPAFNTNHGLGRTALIASILGALLGMHIILLIIFVILKQRYTRDFSFSTFVDMDRTQLLIQWCADVICICIFHLAEFFTTAIYNPRVVSTDSFVVNHSYAYTAAAIVSIVGQNKMRNFKASLYALSQSFSFLSTVVFAGIHIPVPRFPPNEQCIRHVYWLGNGHCCPNN